MRYSFRPAKREQVNLLVSLAGASGSGKTMSALLLAKGLAGGKKFAVIDTEARRGLHYADDFEFDHLDLKSPFSPDNYLGAIQAAGSAGYPVIVVDSFSHEHAGEGGILDMQEAELQRMAGDDWQKRERVKMASWIKPKMAHKRMMDRLLHIDAHLIICLRAEEKIEMKKVNGKTEIVPKTTAAGYTGWIPICEKNLPFEMTASFVLEPTNPGVPVPIKLTEKLRPLIDISKPITEKTGRVLGEWAKGSANATEDHEDAPGSTTSDSALSSVIDMLVSRELTESDACEYLRLDPSLGLESLSVEELRDLYRMVNQGLVNRWKDGRR